MQDALLSVGQAVFAGSLARNKARTLLSVLAIGLGVALGYAVQLISAAAVNELGLGVQFLSGAADLQVRGPRGGFDEAIYPMLAQLPEVAIASPVVEVDARLTDRSEALKILGIDVFRAAGVQPGLIPDSEDRLDVLRSDVLFLSPAAARWLNVAPQDNVTLQNALRPVSLLVAGLTPAERGPALRRDGHRGRPDEFRSARPHHSRRPSCQAWRRCRKLSRPRCSRCCPQGSRSNVRKEAWPPARACRVRIASTSTCSRWLRCSRAACWSSRRRRLQSCGDARNWRCCAYSA